MTKSNSTRRPTKKSLAKSSDPPKGNKKDQKSRTASTRNLGYIIFALAVLVAIVACVVYVSVDKKTPKKPKVSKQKKGNDVRASDHGTKQPKRQGRKDNELY